MAFDHPDAVALRAQMVAEVSTMYTAATPQQNRDGGAGVDPASVVMTAVGYDGDVPVAHVTVRRLAAGLEIKRMFIDPAYRGRGWAALLLEAAEDAVQHAGDTRVLLHTGERQEAAIGLYTSRGYAPIDLYPPYLDVPKSLCFAKDLSA
ncbi:GNAT family N-acetyltransferase [Aeromicrobium sp.]|uniref:GNAT family N-acetyltransferase n=1 Tax=Aeromicrobium sp. TaxID=1871063 RepID=UPI003C6EF4BB